MVDVHEMSMLILKMVVIGVLILFMFSSIMRFVMGVTMKVLRFGFGFLLGTLVTRQFVKTKLGSKLQDGFLKLIGKE